MLIYQVGAPILRQVAQPVDPSEPAVQKLAQEMLQIVKKKGGMGLASPQVGYPWQIIVIASHPNDRYPYAPLREPFVIINPQLISHTSEVETDWEGCLSVPNKRGQVDRYRQVEVHYLDIQGREKKEVFSDFIARIFQHEFDHLQGQLFIDKVPPQSLVSEAEYRQIVQSKMSATRRNLP
ncbi:MAG: peptide deformylase [Pseudanabaenaceae cyanobacterium]